MENTHLKLRQMEILEIKNAVGIISSKNGLNSILVIGEEKIGKLKDKLVEISNTESK